MVKDPFSGIQDSGAFVPLASDPSSATRSYSATTYYAQAKGRPNLHVLTNSPVEKILFDDHSHAPNLRATGVKYTLSNGSTVVVHATKEVILAAGALQSPKMLELSGIGNSKLLNSLYVSFLFPLELLFFVVGRQFRLPPAGLLNQREKHMLIHRSGIPVLVDNPSVGENLQDHLISVGILRALFPSFGLFYEGRDTISYSSSHNPVSTLSSSDILLELAILTPRSSTGCWIRSQRRYTN